MISRIGRALLGNLDIVADFRFAGLDPFEDELPLLVGLRLVVAEDPPGRLLVG